MSTLVTNMQAVASRLLGSYGETVTIRRITPGAYNPATGETAAGSTLEVPVLALVSAGVGGVAAELLRAGRLEGVTVRPGDRIVTIAASDLPTGFVPVSGDSIDIASSTFRVIATTPTPAGADVVIWRLQLRQGGE